MRIHFNGCESNIVKPEYEDIHDVVKGQTFELITKVAAFVKVAVTQSQTSVKVVTIQTLEI